MMSYGWNYDFFDWAPTIGRHNYRHKFKRHSLNLGRKSRMWLQEMLENITAYRWIPPKPQMAFQVVFKPVSAVEVRLLRVLRLPVRLRPYWWRS